MDAEALCSLSLAIVYCLKVRGSDGRRVWHTATILLYYERSIVCVAWCVVTGGTVEMHL